MPPSIPRLLKSPDTRSDVGSPAEGRLDGDDSVWRFQWWKWLTAAAVAGGQTIWFLSRSSGYDGGVVGYFAVSFVGVTVVFAGATWVARRLGVFQYERPWVAIPAVLASVVALASPVVGSGSTGPFVGVYLLLLVVSGAVQSVLE